MELELISDLIDVEDFLIHELKVENVQRIGDSIRMRCPNVFHIDKVSSCFLDPVRLIYHCFGCHTKGNLISLIKLYLDVNYKQAIKYLNNYAGVSNDGQVASVFKIKRDTKEEVNCMLSSHYRRNWNDAPKDILDYANKRRLNFELLKKYYIGYNASLGSITMPVIHGRKIVNIGERFLNPTRPEMKIKYVKGVQLSKCIWGLFEGFSKKSPYFTEGIFDALRLREAGFNAFAMLSNQLPDNKLELLIRIFEGEQLTVVPDNDQGGLDMLRAWKSVLNFSTVEVMPIEGGKDADELSILKLRYLNKKKVKLIDLLCKTTQRQEQLCETFLR